MLRQRVSELFKIWKEWPLNSAGRCCLRDHYFQDDYGIWRFKKDEDICGRELAWRKYVRERDRNKIYPFDKVSEINKA